MRKTRYIIAGLTAAACAVAVTQAPASDRKPTARTSATTNRAACPHLPVPPRYGQIDEVIAATRSLLIRGSIVVQGERVRLTRKNSPVLSATVLARTGTNFPGAAALRRTAVRRCGENTAAASWAVFIGVPGNVADTNTKLAFLVRTERGWRSY